MSKAILFLSVVTMVVISGCASVSSYQTAKTLSQGTSRTYLGGGYLTGKVGDTDVGVPVIEGMYRKGLSDKMDFGIKYTAPVTLVGDVKYNLFGNDESGKVETVHPLALAAGLGAGYLRVSSGDTTTNLIDVYVPVYFSYHTSSTLAFYTTPKYILRISSGSSTGTTHLVAPTVGIAIGKKVQLAVEGTYVLPLNGEKGATQLGFAFNF